MSILALAVILFASIAVTVQRGPGATFVFVFLPVSLLLSSVPALSLPILPDMSSMHAVTYGLLLGMLIVGKLPAFRAHPIDWIVVLLSVIIVASSYASGNVWTIVSSVGSESLHWLLPYYMARLAFRDATLRRQMAILLAFIAMGMAAASLVEWRLKPLIVGKTLKQLHLSGAFTTFVQGRWGFFRAMVTGEHPIDFGNIGLLLTAMIPALAVTSGLRLLDKRILLGTASAGLMILTSMSFSSYCGAIVAAGMFVTVRYLYRSEVLLVPGIAALILVGTIFTATLIDVDLASIKPEHGAELEGSFYTRVEIIQKSWNTYGESAGVLGYGDSVDGRVMSLKSVDNSYMLFLIRRGWSYLLLRFVLAIVIGVVATRMLYGQRGTSGRLPPAAIAAALIGTMVSMYTVWFGFIYAVLWTCLAAMLVSLRQVMMERTAAVAPQTDVFGPAFAPRRHESTPLGSPRPLIARTTDVR